MYGQARWTWQGCKTLQKNDRFMVIIENGGTWNLGQAPFKLIDFVPLMGFWPKADASVSYELQHELIPQRLRLSSHPRLFWLLRVSGPRRRSAQQIVDPIATPTSWVRGWQGQQGTRDGCPPRFAGGSSAYVAPFSCPSPTRVGRSIAFRS